MTFNEVYNLLKNGKTLLSNLLGGSYESTFSFFHDKLVTINNEKNSYKSQCEKIMIRNFIDITKTEHIVELPIQAGNVLVVGTYYCIINNTCDGLIMFNRSYVGSSSNIWVDTKINITESKTVNLETDLRDYLHFGYDTSISKYIKYIKINANKSLEFTVNSNNYASIICVKYTHII